MSQLSPRDRALVGLGAALGSNCIPCIEHHVPAARNAGLSDDEIRSAISIADNIRLVPARRVLARAAELVSAKPADPSASASGGLLDGPSATTEPAMTTSAPSDCSNPPKKTSSGGCC